MMTAIRVHHGRLGWDAVMVLFSERVAPEGHLDSLGQSSLNPGSRHHDIERAFDFFKLLSICRQIVTYCLGFID